MASSSGQISVDGLDEFLKGLDRLQSDLPKAMRTALAGVAELVAVDARKRVKVRTGRARSSVLANVTDTNATVTGGSARAPYYPWLDFGGTVGRNHSIRRPYIKTGRYIGPAYTAQRARIDDALAAALVDAAEQAGLDVGSR